MKDSTAIGGRKITISQKRSNEALHETYLDSAGGKFDGGSGSIGRPKAGGRASGGGGQTLDCGGENPEGILYAGLVVPPGIPTISR